ncbi:MAG: Tol-Pal system beta propeller repeat protein TolB [Candidatus Rokubacteria bacterium]|nr:Tol-Pal system beta propeller repeat protein TolB [Candidatus Rokubacteria bacterium]
MKRTVGSLMLSGLVIGLSLLPPSILTPPSHSQGVDVFLNVTQGGAKKLGIAIPEFTRLRPAPDDGNFSRALPEIIGNDLRFSALFTVVANEPPLPVDAETLKKRLADLAAAGAHAAMQGFLSIAGQRVTVEFRLYDLTNPEFRPITSKSFWAEPLREHRRLAHRIADEIVYQFTGERGIAETKIAYVTRVGSNKEIAMLDYDGFNQIVLTDLRSISLSPVWSPVDASIAFTSFFKGYPYLFQLYPFNPRRREPGLLSAWPGINSAAAWSPDGKAVAITLSKDGNPEIYTLRVGMSDFRRLTNNRAIDTDPTWSPTGREIAFSSDRMGAPQVWIMDAEGANPRRLTTGNYDTQPRWSPRGDTIVFTRRTSGGFDLWGIAPDGGNERPLTHGSGDNESAAWAPNGRHIVFSSARGARSQIYTMLADGSEQQPLTRDRGEASSPSWSPRPQ